MKKWDDYTDQDNVRFAKGEYGDYKVGQPYKIGKDRRTAGYVQEKYGFDKNGNPCDSRNGEQAYVVTPENIKNPKNVQQVAVVYRGSNSHFVTQPTDSIDDWVGNDAGLGTIAFINEKRVKKDKSTMAGYTPQLESSADTLNDVAKKYPNAKIYVYGQSLGSMDAQYAIASMNDPDRLAHACVYEGPNMYNNLTPEQKKTADKLTKEGKIQNFVDVKDCVPVGYAKPSKSIGTLYYVKSEGYHGIVGQHMWGGYKFDKQGHLETEEIDDGLKLAFSEINVDYKKAYDYAAKGGLSDSEKIMLDAAAGRAILQSLSSQVDTKIEELRHEIHQEMNKCDENWQDCISRAQMVGGSLSREEIIDALNDGGCTKDIVVTKPKAKYEQYLSKLSSVEDSLNEWLNKMNQAVDKILGTDNKIAGYFD